MALEDRVTESWEAWSNREAVIAEHLKNLYEAQDGLANIVAGERFGRAVKKQLTGWAEFFIPMFRVLSQSEVKFIKIINLKKKSEEKRRKKGNGEKKEGKEDETNAKEIEKKEHDIDDETLALIKRIKETMMKPNVPHEKDITIAEYATALCRIGQLYDQLGYSSPEKKVVRTGLVSDLQIDEAQIPEEMEAEAGEWA